MNAHLLLRRSKALDVRQLGRILLPLSINYLLYIGEELPQMHRNEIPSYAIKQFSIERKSGIERIDRKLTPYNFVYVVFDSDETVHESWVSFDTVLPSQYGFDSHLPVIGHSFTAPQYRGKGIFPYTLNYILHDLKSRNISKSAYVLVSCDNKTSIKGIQRAGFRCLAQLKGTRVLGCLILKKSTIRFD